MKNLYLIKSNYSSILIIKDLFIYKYNIGLQYRMNYSNLDYISSFNTLQGYIYLIGQISQLFIIASKLNLFICIIVVITILTILLTLTLEIYIVLILVNLTNIPISNNKVLFPFNISQLYMFPCSFKILFALFIILIL